MVAKRGFASLLALLLVLSGCAVFQGDDLQKIALLAPFEGRYREIGYDALYAARLAISESNIENIDLLAIDDGGSVETAIMRANAIRQDSTIKAVITLGLYATDERVQAALGETPILIVGNWGAEVASSNSFMLSNPAIADLISWNGEVTSIPDELTIGSEILALYQVPKLLVDTSNVTIYSSASLPDEAYRQRILNSGLYVPEPNLVSSLTYDASALVLEALRTNTPISEITYEGINGRIAFENAYWLDAPIHVYTYSGNQLLERPSMTP